MLKLLKISFNILVVAMTLMLTIMWFWKNEAFEIKAVKIQGNHFLTKEEIFELAGMDFSKDIFGIDTDEIESAIARHPMIEKVRVTRFLPSTLKINVKERDLIAAMSGSEVTVVDKKAAIVSHFPTEAAYDLPVITGFHVRRDSTRTLQPDQPERVAEAVAILNKIKNQDLVLYYQVSELHYSPNYGFVFYLKTSNLPVIFGKGDYDRKISYFATIYHYLYDKNELRHARVIDIRFDDQVVVKTKT